MRIRIIQLFFLVSIILFAACANRSSGPQGGPKDITPPKFHKSVPENGQTNFSGKRLEIEFDEFVSLDNSQSKVIVSPPQTTPPILRTSGKKVIVELSDSLQPNTCYTVDFTNSIVDLNEKNALEGYSFAFSTGEVVDTMQISGMVIDAATLNPLSNIMIGVYDDLSDSAFFTKKPLRIGRTNQEGRFCVRNVKNGTYRVYALEDKDNNFMYDNLGESFAFLDTAVVTRSAQVMQTDTLRRDSLSGGDSIIHITKTEFYPNNLLFSLSARKVNRQRFLKAERKEPFCIKFFFGYPAEHRPTLRSVEFPDKQLLCQYAEKFDTITCWLTDSTMWKMETLHFTLAYEKPDSTETMVLTTDTVKTFFGEKALKKALEKPSFLRLEGIPQVADYYKPLAVSFSVPVSTIDTSKIHFYSTADSVWAPIVAKFSAVDTLGLRYSIAHQWNPELKYRIVVDSAAVRSKLNTENKELKAEFSIKGPEHYSLLSVLLLQPNEKAILQLLSEKDEVVAQRPFAADGTTFEYLTPGTYFLRLFVDANADGQWSPANYKEKLQPEEVYYFNTSMLLRENWDVEQEWDFLSGAREKQKPAALLQLKKDDKNKK